MAFIKSYEQYCDPKQLMRLDNMKKFMWGNTNTPNYANLTNTLLDQVSKIVIDESDRAIERLNTAKDSYNTAIQDKTQKQDRKDLLGKHQECVMAILHIDTVKSRIANGILVGNAVVNAGKTNISISSGKNASSDNKIQPTKVLSVSKKSQLEI